MPASISIPSVSVKYAQDGNSTKSNALGMRPMQERAYQKRGEPYLLIKSPPASGKSRALMFIALDKLANQKLKQAIIVVPEKAIGASFNVTGDGPPERVDGVRVSSSFFPLLGARPVIGRVLTRPGDIEVGITMALVGAPFFLILLARTRSGYEL